MPLFFEATPPEGDKITYGPFETGADLDLSRDAVIEDRPDWTIGDAFTENANYIRTLPRPYAQVPQNDGTTLELWTDGTEKTIPAE
jgi:hypothetical protein